MEKTQQLALAIVKHVDLQEIKTRLSALSKNDILREDKKHFDILHYAIEANYIEVVHLLFLKGYFFEPYLPKFVPYLHLACKHGRTAILNILLKERPNDLGRSIQSNNFSHLPTSNSDLHRGDGESESSYTRDDYIDCKSDLHLQNFSPLDIAAEGGHLKCVQTLLNSFDTRAVPNQSNHETQRNENQRMSFLETAVEKCSTKTVQLLLSSSEVQQRDVNSAFKMALHRKLSDCMHVLLSDGNVQVSSILNDMNPFHVLYMYSSAYQTYKERNYCLDKATSVLISHGFDVNDFSKCGSFPMYSLLNSLIEEKDFYPMETPKYHLKALELLLEAGADPNFDEVTNSLNIATNPYGQTLGRPLHTSALNALFGSLQTSDNWYAMFPEFVTHCCGLLLRGGCNPKRVDGRGRTVLHDVMKCLAMEHTMGNMGINVLPIIQILMRYGADPNIYSASELYPVSSYFQTLFNLMDGRLAFDNWKASKCQAQVLHLLSYMTHANASEASQQIIQICQSAEEKSVAKVSLVSFVTFMLHQYSHKHLCLQDLCRLQIWESIDRQRDKLACLPLPKSLQNSVLNHFC